MRIQVQIKVLQSSTSIQYSIYPSQQIPAPAKHLAPSLRDKISRNKRLCGHRLSKMKRRIWMPQ